MKAREAYQPVSALQAGRLIYREDEFLEAIQADAIGPVPFAKIFLFPFDPNHFYVDRIPAHTEGRFAIVTNVGRGCGGRGCAFDESAYLRTAKSCGPDASTPASSFAEVSASRR
jgi:hypothetical protein